MECITCKSNDVFIKQYDNHVFNLKQILKSTLKNITGYPFKGQIVVCRDCGHGYLVKHPTAEVLKKYYEAQYWKNRHISENKILKDDFKKDLRAKYQLKFILDNVTFADSINTLEIGGGPTFGLLYLRNLLANKTIKINVCEPGKEWEDHYKYHNIQKISDFFPFSTNLTFDYIHTSHWLEHVADLDDTLIHIKKVLSKDGYLFVEVPNCTTDYWKLPFMDSPHIQFFTKASLKIKFESMGFKLIKMEEVGITTKEWASGMWPEEKDYSPKKDGFWIRAIFQKVN